MERPRQTESLRDREARRARGVRRITWIGLVVNVGLAAFKFVAGILGASQAIVADAVHSLSDASTDVAILVGVRYWSRPADKDHPHGHGRIETMVTLSLGLLLTGVATGLVIRALLTLSQQHAARPGAVALVAAAVSIVVKEALYRWSVAGGRRLKSMVVVANAWHHRSDALSSIPALLAVAGARAGADWLFLDHVGAIAGSLFIYQAAFKIIWPALRKLTDAGAPPDQLASIRKLALATDGVRRVHAVRTRYAGCSSLAVDLHVEVDSDLTVRRGHDISESVETRLLADGPDVIDVVVHLEPLAFDGDAGQA